MHSDPLPIIIVNQTFWNLLFYSIISDTLRLKPETTVQHWYQMSQLIPASHRCQHRRFSRKCAFHSNNVIKVDLHVKREGVEQLQSPFQIVIWDSARRWNECELVCASQIESFNYFSGAIWFSACVVFMTISQFWKAKASIDLINVCHQTVSGKRWTRQITWNEIIILRSVTLTVDVHTVKNTIAVTQTHTHADTQEICDVYLVSFPWWIGYISW